MPRGQPTKYLPEYVELAKQSIGEQGKSINQFARDLRVSRQSIYQWAKDHPDFSDALTQAREWSEAFWEDRMAEFMVDRNANAPLVKLYLHHRFGWSDKEKESSRDNEITVTLVDATGRNQ